MKVLPNFVDMKKDAAELAEEAMPFDMKKYDPPLYPYGLGICLENDQLNKLDLDADCDVGDTVHLQAIGKVTSASKNDTADGVKQRVEIQITHIALAEEHDDEAGISVAPRKRPGPSAFYK